MFYVNDPSAVKKCVTLLERYLCERKDRFEIGVVYDLDEYPKFENATVIVSGQYVVYTILDRENICVVKDVIKTTLK